MKRLTGIDDIRDELPESYHKIYGLRLYVPFIVLVVLMTGPNILPGRFPDLGMPLVFLISAVLRASLDDRRTCGGSPERLSTTRCLSWEY